MATYEDKMVEIDQMSDEDLESLSIEITEAFDAADDSNDLEAMAAAADALDQVKSARGSRKSEEDDVDKDKKPEPVAAAAEEGASTEPVADPADPAEPTEPAPTPEPTPDPAPPVTEDPAAPPTEPEITSEEPALAPAPAPEPTEGDPAAQPPTTEVTTDTNKEDTPVDIPEDRAPVPTETTPTNVITAAADNVDVSQGYVFKDANDLSSAFVSRIDSIRGVTSGSGEKLKIATIQASAVDESRILNERDPKGNAEKIRAATSMEAVTAAGGHCAPLESRYTIFGLGTAVRPVRDSLAGFQAGRGGIRYNAGPKLGDLEEAVGVWTAATDAAPGSAVKAKFVVECQPELTATVDAVTLQLQFGNLMSRAYPELVTANNEMAMIEHARLAEMTLISKIQAGSLDLTGAALLGVARDFLRQVSIAGSRYRARHRMGRTDRLRLMAPAWLLDAIRDDLSMQAPGDDKLSAADAELSGYLNDRNVNVTWYIDDADMVTAETDNSSIDTYPAVADWFLFAEGTWLFLDGGTLDLGVVRDASLVETNDYITFSETFETVAKVGHESLHVATAVQLAGSYAGPTDTTLVGS